MDAARLKDKLAKVCKEHHDIETNKKFMASTFNSQLRTLKKQMEAISDTISLDDPEHVMECKHFTDQEKKDLLGDSYHKGTIFN